MSRRSGRMAEEAAREASEAARTLQARGQNVRQQQESPEPASQPESRREVEREELPAEKIEELRDANPHTLAMEEIYRRSDQRQGLPEVKEEAPEPETPAPAEAAPQPEATVAPVVEAQPVETPTVPETVRVKVDGEEFDAPKAEVEAIGGIQVYQIQKAAENRLRKATEANAEAKRLLELASQRATPQAPVAPSVTDDEFIRSKLDAIRFGSDEEGAAALRDIVARNRPDTNQLTAQAVAAMEHQTAVRAFDAEFADVMKVPLGPEMVVMLRSRAIASAQQSQAPIDWHSTYRTIGTQVRNALVRPSQPTSVATAPATTEATAPSPTSSVSAKEAKKASIVNPPTSAARAAVPAEPKPESREDVLNQMRKSRGLPTE